MRIIQLILLTVISTVYLLRRCPEVNLDPIFQRWDNTLYSWIGISIYLLAIKKNEGVLIYPQIVATADDGYSLLPYSLRVFGNLYIVTKDSIELSGKCFEEISPGLKNLKCEDEIILNLTGLLSHFSRKTSLRYTPDVYKKELAFFKKNWPLVFYSRRRLIRILKSVFNKICNLAHP